MFQIIEIQNLENNSLFHDELKIESASSYKLFVFQKPHQTNGTVKYIPALNFNGKTAFNLKNYFLAVARYIYTNINDKANTILIIKEPVHFIVAQYLKTKLPLRLILVAGLKKESYLELLKKSYGNLIKDKGLQNIIDDAYILSDQIICKVPKLKDYLVKDLSLKSDKITFLSKLSIGTFLQSIAVQRVESDHMKLRKHYFHLKAKAVLFKVKNALEELGIPYWIDYGTLLGAVRENGFIGNDIDIDLGLLAINFSDDIECIMHKYGFTKIAQYKLKDSQVIAEQTYILDNVHVDLFFYQKNNNKIIGHYFYTNSSFQYDMEHNGGLNTMEVFFDFKGIDYIRFLDTVFPAPKDYNSHLKQHYGDNYLTPDLNWDYKVSPRNINKIKTKGDVEY